MAEDRLTWSPEDLQCFLESCMEEIAARNITSNSLKYQGCINLEKKMLAKRGKVVTKKQIKNFWEQCRRRWVLWSWLESRATGLGRDLVTQAIQADDTWWERIFATKKEAFVIQNAPLKFIPEHHAVFRGRTITGDHSAVPGAAPEHGSQDEDAPPEPIDVDALQNIPFRVALPEPISSQKKGKGKRTGIEETSGGLSKKTRSDSAGAALQRLADLRMESMESWARSEEEKRGRSPKACMGQVVADGYPSCSPLWFKALDLFHDPYWRLFYLSSLSTLEERVAFIETTYNMVMYRSMGHTGPPPMSSSGGPSGFGGGGSRQGGGSVLGVLVWGEWDRGGYSLGGYGPGGFGSRGGDGGGMF